MTICIVEITIITGVEGIISAHGLGTIGTIGIVIIDGVDNRGFEAKDLFLQKLFCLFSFYEFLLR